MSDDPYGLDRSIADAVAALNIDAEFAYTVRLEGLHHGATYLTRRGIARLVEMSHAGQISKHDFEMMLPVNLWAEDLTLAFEFPFPGGYVEIPLARRSDPWRA